MPVAEQLHLDRFTAVARQALQNAQYQAAQMQAQEVYPEHLLLGVLAQDDDEVAEVMRCLGMNMHELRAQAAAIFESSASVSSEVHSVLPLTQEAHACLDWAETFAEQQGTSLIPPAYLLLSAIRHQRVQPLLALLLSSAGTLFPWLAERTGLDYTSAIDQLTQAKVGEPRSRGERWTPPVFKVERPTLTFADILGAETAKQELDDVITLLRWSQSFLTAGKTARRGVLIVGHPCTERTLLVHATASEAVAPLIRLPLTTLVWILLDASERGVAYEGRMAIRQAFEQAKRRAPSLLFLDDLDALERLEAQDERESLLNEILVELDALESRPPVVVIATLHKPEMLVPALLAPGRFDRQIRLSESFAIHPAAQTKLCLSCKREVLPNWTYCIYCGALLVKTCPTCGAPHIEVEGARFCFVCGSAWRTG